MPLLEGKSNKVKDANRKELFRSAKKKKKIGNIPLSNKSADKVRAIIEAVTQSKARK